MEKPTSKTKVKRAPKRGHYDLATIKGILDSDFICHVGFIHEDYPVVIPTLYGRSENFVYLHGATASRMMKGLSSGLELCLTVTLVDGIVLARSAFHHSMNYRSVVLFGKATMVIDPEERMAALKALTDQVIPERWEEVRTPNEKEMKATTILKIPIETASAKIRAGGPNDDKADYELDIWAGHIPIKRSLGEVIPDPLLEKTTNLSSAVVKLKQKEA